MKKTVEELKEIIEGLSFENLDFSTDENLDDDKDYVEAVYDRFVKGGDIESDYLDLTCSFVPEELEELLKNASYLSSYVDDYLAEVGANSLVNALRGGYDDYYRVQATSNTDAIYNNALVEHLTSKKTEVLQKIDSLSYEEVVELMPLCILEYPEDALMDFIEDIADSPYTFPASNLEDLKNKFADFVNERIEEESDDEN